jgi:hypothetical protein
MVQTAVRALHTLCALLLEHVREVLPLCRHWRQDGRRDWGQIRFIVLRFFVLRFVCACVFVYVRMCVCKVYTHMSACIRIHILACTYQKHLFFGCVRPGELGHEAVPENTRDIIEKNSSIRCIEDPE